MIRTYANKNFFSIQKYIHHSLQVDHISTKPALLAYQALTKELFLTPKPGLVDIDNSGSHQDMDVFTFIESINAISPWFDQFYIAGLNAPYCEATAFLAIVRRIGIQCEKSMFKATNNINTHKGGIFAFALLLSAIGRLEGRNCLPTIATICNEVSLMCENLVEKELENNASFTAKTAGEKLYDQYGFTGARGEAASGYATVRKIALPIYFELKQKNLLEDEILLQTLLHLFAYNNDTNLVSRGGLEGLQFVQHQARDLINLKITNSEYYIAKMQRLDLQFIERNLSPGGSADLLSVTYFLAQYPKI